MASEFTIAIVGIGSIGSYLARAIHDGHAGATRVVAVADRPERCRRLQDVASQCGCAWTTDPLRLPDFGPSIVIEAAGPHVVQQYAVPLLECGTSVFVMSAGALADGDFLLQVQNVLRRSRGRLYLPSGAIGGLDVLRAAAIDGLEEVRLRTTKPPDGLRGAPWFVDHPVNWSEITAPMVLFRGPVADAVRGFPQNMNIAAVLQLASLGICSITVEVAVDPASGHNVHELYARGTFGDMTLRIANVPSNVNPKTSHLACLSPLALLRRLSASLVVGS